MKKMNVLLSLLLSFILAAGLCAPAFAATGDTGFSDVAASAWYADAVTYVRDNGLMNGTGATTFSPEADTSRAMLTAILYRASGSPAATATARFSDVPSNAYYANAAAWASGNNIVSGYGNGRFGSNDPVTREQIATILWRYAGSPNAGTAQNFADEGQISAYAKDAVDWARANGIINGMSGNRFAPKNHATRAQVATILRNYLTTSQPEQPDDGTGSKALVAYFSRAGENYNVGVVEKGNTAVVAEMIAEQAGADLFEIRPVTPYPSDYNEMLAVSRRETQEDARPEIANTVDNWDSYDVVFLGYPIWNGDMPKIVYHFLESYNFSGKTIVPFCTHAGSGLSNTVSTIRSLCPSAVVANGFAIAGATAQNNRAETKAAVEKWVAEDLKDILPNPSANTDQTGAFNLKAGNVMLNNGITMPVLGIGTYRLSDEQAENSVYWALRDGYRLIDTARIYGNEAGVGRGIRRAISEGFVARKDIFVTTKMWTSDYDNGDAAINASLDRLGLDYIDLMILHHSDPNNDVAAYQAMERAVADGRLHCIGLSNYYTASDFDRLVNATTIRPALLQNETHPYHQSEDMKAHIARYGTVMESWFPLGGRGNTQTLFNDPVIAGIADAHGKTSAQVILRWHLQAGNIAIPGSSNENHIAENYDIFDFELTLGEMAQMTALNKNERLGNW